MLPVARLIGACLVVASVLGIAPRTQAQPEDDIWGEPVNLSHSGAASVPTMVIGPEGTLQAFWWDQIDGLTTVRYDGESWSAPVAAPIVSIEVVGEGERAQVVYTTLERMPAIVGGGGYVHAWWLGEADEDTGYRPLMHSRLALGSASWSGPDLVAESSSLWHMVADPAGVLHLAYVRDAHSDAYPAGVYYKRSVDGGASWSAPAVLYNTIYFRLLTAENGHLWVASDDAGQVYVAWDDSRLGQVFYAQSTDGGVTWGEPQQAGDPEEESRRIHMVAGPEGQTVRLWGATQAATPCALYQQISEDGGQTWGERQHVLDGLGSCPEEMRFLRGAGGEVFVITGSGSSGLTLAAWDGSAWSEPEGVGFSFEDPETGGRVYLSSLRAVLSGDALVVVGVGQDGEVWVLQSQVSALDWVFAPPSPWVGPVPISQGVGWPGVPAIAADGEGRVHVLWGEASEEGAPSTVLYYARLDDSPDGATGGGRWTNPTEVLRSLGGKADQPALVIVGDQLHAVWSGGQNGEIFYSRAYVRDAYAASGWSGPQPLPAPGDVGSSPVVVADLLGTLHVVYAVPFNEGRGIYYTRSEDGGETWSEAQAIFDAELAGWTMAEHPTLVADERGTLHVAWAHGSASGPFPPQGILYARSVDGGETWSEPVEMVEGAYDWPRLAATLTGQVHLLWNTVEGNRAWYQRWSVDGGQTWTPQQQVRGFGDVPGPVALAVDGAGILHLVGVGHGDPGERAVLYTTWEGERWGEAERFGLEAQESGGPGAAIGLRSALGRLDVVFRGSMSLDEGARQGSVLYVSRSIPAVGVTPVPAFTPRPTMTPTPGPTPTPTPTPRPAVDVQEPPPAPPTLELGPLSLPLTAVGGFLLVVVLVLGVLAARALWMRRR